MTASMHASALPGAGRHLEVAGHGGGTAVGLALDSVSGLGQRHERDGVSATLLLAMDGAARFLTVLAAD
jgi:hypothetical protein